jgi:sugar lactone lactonase YvrE
MAAACLVAAVGTGPADAGAPQISTFAGSLGVGPATRVAQDPMAVAVHGRTLYLGAGALIRAVDLDTGSERVVAGTGLPGPLGDGGPATAASLEPGSMAVDGAGNLYFIDNSSMRIRRIDAAGRITTVAGGGVRSDEGAPALETRLWSGAGIALDPAGAIYYTDLYRVRRVDPNGTVSTVAGTGGSAAFAGDGGPALLAHLYAPGDLAVDPAGRLHIADGPRIITTVAGGGTYPFGANGIRATDAELSAYGLAFDPAGNLLIADWRWVRRVDVAGRITTIAGNGLFNRRGDGKEVDPGDGEPATGVPIGPYRLAVDAAGNVYATEWGRARVRRIAPSGIITTAAGNGTVALGGDSGPARQAQLFAPAAVGGDAEGNVYISDSSNGRVRKVSPGGTITSLPPALQGPGPMVVDDAGRVFVGVSGGVVMRLDPDGLVTRWAGGGIGDIPDGGRATGGWLAIGDLAVDHSGNLYLIDSSRIRKVDAAGTITTVAGGGFAQPADGLLARSAALAPVAVAVDAGGRVIFADLGAQRIWRVGADGRLETVAGTTPGFSGDGGPATSAQLRFGIPSYSFTGDLAVDRAGQIFVLDYLNNRVRRIDTSGVITTVAGNGEGDDAAAWPPRGGEGVAATATPVTAHRIGLDYPGNLYLVDIRYDRVLIVPGLGLSAPPPTAAARTAVLAAAAGSGAGPSTTSSTLARAVPSTPVSAPVPPAPTTSVKPVAASADEAAPSPVPVASLTGVATIAAGGHHGLSGSAERPDRPWELAAAMALVVSSGAVGGAWRRRRPLRLR